MASNVIYTCSKCGAQFPKWSGRCLECGAWGTIGEETVEKEGEVRGLKSLDLKKIKGANLVDLSQVSALSSERLQTGWPEIDRVLGGGLVKGSLILLAGEPGIGKSTLANQITDLLGVRPQGEGSDPSSIIYVSGEESASQVKTRLERLGCDLHKTKFIGETHLEKIMSSLLELKPALVIIDSIQTIYSSELPSEAGSLNQIRAVAVKFLELAKTHDITIFLIGHITKDGQIAGPKSLEHIVDTVLYLENDQTHFSILRAVKNRFGSLNEIGVLEMTSSGFKEIKNPSAIFIEGMNEEIAGSAMGVILEGTRPFIVNIQALVTKTIFGYPQRKCAGFDVNRLQILSAVLSRKNKINLSTQDIVLNLVGGLKTNDPALDLAAVMAMVSSYLNQPLPRDLIIIGEIGLGGEVRPVKNLETRVKEAVKLGFKTIMVPDSLNSISGVKLLKVKNISEALKLLSNK